LRPAYGLCGRQERAVASNVVKPDSQGEQAMEGRKIAGLALAASAAAIFTAGCANMGSGTHMGTEAKVACNGANACKGQSECKTANNSCHGQNACKGQGFVSLTAEECKQATGRS
jgi:hypothetical protein